MYNVHVAIVLTFASQDDQVQDHNYDDSSEGHYYDCSNHSTSNGTNVGTAAYMYREDIENA